tara:strand:- start:335 stop:1645 length:1311 start_codon:yes stop_codon:yes gene_type:complete
MNNNFHNKFFNDLTLNSIGYVSFLIGVFLLPSAVGISIIFFLCALIISFLNIDKFIKDKWNYPFFISGLLMLISTFIHFLRYDYYINLGLDPKLSLLGLINWLPFFLCFWGFQQYLNTPAKRISTAKFLISGSIAVICSGILQLLNINGPFQLFNGLIIWFQKPLTDLGSISGLFNNQNYAGLWMVMVWPFCLAAFIKPNRKILKKIILLIICVLFVVFICLTDSRNALLGLVISSPIVMGSASLIWYLPTIFLGFFLLGLTVIPIFPDELQIFMKSIIPSRLYTLFPEIGIKYLSTYPRINKWLSALIYITEKPIFGWGAASFPILYQMKSGEWFGHAHNLPLELAVSYGVLPSIIIFSYYSLLLFLSFRKISKYSKKKIDFFQQLNQKAWIASSLIFFIAHLADIQYYDARISIFCWILLAGLRSFLKEKEITT